mmetsp:Transcript_4924/g.10923  ORF Transcript_4924/g.10923 Transcript_4924/m.10923 type:complete len:312 (-) Transcript_4924:1279-2214(-)
MSSQDLRLPCLYPLAKHARVVYQHARQHQYPKKSGHSRRRPGWKHFLHGAKVRCSQHQSRRCAELGGVDRSRLSARLRAVAGLAQLLLAGRERVRGHDACGLRQLPGVPPLLHAGRAPLRQLPLSIPPLERLRGPPQGAGQRALRRCEQHFDGGGEGGAEWGGVGVHGRGRGGPRGALLRRIRDTGDGCGGVASGGDAAARARHRLGPAAANAAAAGLDGGAERGAAAGAGAGDERRERTRRGARRHGPGPSHVLRLAPAPGRAGGGQARRADGRRHRDVRPRHGHFCALRQLCHLLLLRHPHRGAYLLVS